MSPKSTSSTTSSCSAPPSSSIPSPSRRPPPARSICRAAARPFGTISGRAKSSPAAGPIELRIYAGADGEFVLYEDENDNYNCEKGIYATIPIRWDEARQELTLGKRQGSFPGTLEDREFHVVWVAEGHGAAVGQTPEADSTLSYNGNAITVKRPSE